MKIGKCRSCGAEIIWAYMLPGKKAAPIDAAATYDGNIVLRDHGSSVVAHILAPGDHRSDNEPTYTSHFATCPDADEWRTRG